MKEWPKFNESGDLPIGIHRATLAEVAAFGGEDQAIAFWQDKRNGERRGIVEVISND
ncbi:MAG: hypothetical protein PVH61_18310 [Candidatus Aminicenantes bacterium]|jgi:hypothetical protein